MIDGFVETFPGAPIDGLVEPHVRKSWAEAKEGDSSPTPAVPPDRDTADQDANLHLRLTAKAKRPRVGNYLPIGKVFDTLVARSQ